MLLGDFNLPLINWCTQKFSNDFKSCMFFNFMTDFGFAQLVLEPTRKSNILDLLLVNNPFIISSFCIDEPFSTSDHESIICRISAESSLDCSNTVNNMLCWHRADWQSLCESLSFIEWDKIFANCETATDYWQCFLNVLSICPS